MINIEELRIGNKFLFHSYNGKKYEQKIDSDDIVMADEGSIKYFLKHYAPIKITEKHLIELGFEKQGDSFIYELATPDKLIEVMFSKNTPYVSMVQLPEMSSGDEQVFSTSIKHVHQLQNLITDLS